MNETTATISTVADRSEDGTEGVDGELFGLAFGEIAAGRIDDANGAVLEKLNEYRVLVAPVERAIRELHLTRGMMRARAEDELNALSPALAALAETLGISTLDLLTSPDRAQFLHDALRRSSLPVDELRRRMGAAAPELPRLAEPPTDSRHDAAPSSITPIE